MARAIIAQFQPHEDWLIRTAEFPPGVNAEDRRWHGAAKGTRTPSKPVVLLVREPVSRFVTACQQVGIHQGDIEAAVASLVHDTDFTRTQPNGVTQERWDLMCATREASREKIKQRRLRLLAMGRPVDELPDPRRLRQNVHFFKQSDYIFGPTTCFRFPRDIAAVAAFLGIAAPMPEVNKAKRPKPTLTSAQQEAVRAYYAADVLLFDSILSPATVVNGAQA